MQKLPDESQPCGQPPPGPGGFGTGNGSVRAAVDNSTATMTVVVLMGAPTANWNAAIAASRFGS
jgi:hypothetical protein